MFKAALMAECEGITIAVLAPVLDTASELLAKIVEKFLQLPGCQNRIVEDNKKHVEIARPSEVDEHGELKSSKGDILSRRAVNRLVAYPANPDGTSPVVLLWDPHPNQPNGTTITRKLTG
jgi:hypothetical protein